MNEVKGKKLPDSEDCKSCHRVLLFVNGAKRCVVTSCPEYNKPVEEAKS